MRRVVIAWVLLVSGCRGAVTDHVPLTIRFPGAPACHDAVGPMSLTALGDFPTRDIDVVPLDPTHTPFAPITQFPETTLALSASALAPIGTSRSFGWASLASLVADDALTLRPIGVSCPLADPEARLPIGAAIAVIDEATVMVVGELDDNGASTRRVAILHARTESVELPSIARTVPVAFAAATRIGDRVVVSGGAASATGAARDTWESLPLDLGSATLGVLSGPRRDHSSIAVEMDGVPGVLLVGGTDGNNPVRTIEWLDPSSGNVRVLRAAFEFETVRPRLLAIDASHIVIYDSDGGVAEMLDLAADEVFPVTGDPGLGDWSTPLADGRLVAGRGDAFAGFLAVADPRTGRLVFVDATLPSLADAVAVGTPRGHVLVEGRLSDGSRGAFVIDPGLGTFTSVDSSRVPRALVALLDGTVLELAATGASMRLDDALTPFDAPPPSYLFASDRAVLSLDAAPNWAVSNSALRVAAGVDAARLDVPVLRFAQFDALVDAGGAWDFIVTGEHGETLATVSVTDETITLGACSVDRVSASDRARVMRAGGDLVASWDHESSSCREPIASPRVGVGIVAHATAALRSLTLTRVPGP